MNKDFFFFKKNSEYSIYNNIKERLKQVLSSKKKLVDSEIISYLELNLKTKSIEPESVCSGFCEKHIKEHKRKMKSNTNLINAKDDCFSEKEKRTRQMHSSTELGNSEELIFSPSSKSVQNDDKNSINSDSISIFSSEVESVHNEEPGSIDDTLSIKSLDNNDISENISLSSSYNTITDIKNNNKINILPSINSSNSSLLTENQTTNNININKNKENSNNNNTKINKTQLEDDI